MALLYFTILLTVLNDVLHQSTGKYDCSCL